MDNVTTTKAALVGFLAAMTALWGWFGWLVLIWIGTMILDHLSGTGAAAKNKEWKSSVARDGIWRKVGCIITVMVAGATDLLIGTVLGNVTGITFPYDYTVLLCPLVLVWYVVTELGSIAENAAKMGAPVPSWLLNFLVKTKDTADDIGDKL